MKQSDIRALPFVLTNRHGDPLRGDVHIPDGDAPSPVLVICHGFKGFKDWGMFPYAADYFARRGWIVVRFNFSLNGIGENPLEFTRLDNFRRNTASRELDDLDDIFAAIEANVIVPEKADATRLALLGHSLGGGISIVKASEDARVRALVTWAGVSTFDRWGPKLKEQWRADGVLEIQNARTGQMMPMGIGMLDDFEANLARLDILAAASRIDVPFLIINGEQDMAVPPDEARAIHRAAASMDASLVLIQQADHVFGAAHPFAGSTVALEGALNASAAFLGAFLA